MARPLVGSQRADIADPNAKHWLRAYVRRFDATWIPLHNIPGLGDMLVGAQITERLDANMMSASVRTGLTHQMVTMSPLSAASVVNDDGGGGYAPFLNGGSLIRIDQAITTGAVPVDADFIRMFEGKIDEPNFTQNPLTLTCRDMGSVLTDTTIREKRTYGTAAGIPAHDVMQQILTDNQDVIGSLVTLEVPVAPTYLVTDYTPFEVSVMDGLNTLAAKFGWVVRYRFNAAGAFVLTLYDPQRDKVVADDSIAPTEYRDVDRAALVTTALRNVVSVDYVTPAGEPANSGLFIDVGSAAVFGQLYIKIGGEATKDIRTQGAAQNLAQLVLKDLSRPLFEFVIKTPLAWFVQLGDLLELLGNDIHWDAADAPQMLAVRSIVHDWPDQGNGPAMTTLEMSGKPAGAYEGWLKRQGGVLEPELPPAPGLDFLVAEGTQFGGTEATVDGGIWLGYRLPPGVDEARFHVLLGDGPNLGVPNIDGPTLAPVIRRPEGDIGATIEYASMVLFSTDLRYWKRIMMLGVRGGLTSRPVITESIQAVDPVPTPIDGTIAAFTVDRDGDVNTVTVTPGVLEGALGSNYLCIMRNKHVLPPIPIGTSTAPVVFIDSGLDPSKAATYVYEPFIANMGPTWCVTGGQKVVIAAPPALEEPVFVNNTPLAASLAGAPRVQIDWECATAGAVNVQVEASADGINARVVGIGALNDSILDTVIGPKLYRLVALGPIIMTNPRLVVTPWKWYSGLPNVLSNPTFIPQFANGTPKPVFGSSFPTMTFRLGISWTCQTPGAVLLAIQMSNDNGVVDPWTDVPSGVSASVASGSWRSPDDSYLAADRYYRLEARTAAGAPIAASLGVHYIPIT